MSPSFPEKQGGYVRADEVGLLELAASLVEERSVSQHSPL